MKCALHLMNPHAFIEEAVTMVDGTAVCLDCAGRIRELGSVYAAILEAREGRWVI